MAFCSFNSLVLLFFPIIISSSLAQVSDSRSGPSMVDCGPRLLPLTPCISFVQGSVASPAQPCCDNLIKLYDEQPNCLCMLLNGTAMSSLPINKTLALQLPSLCHLQVNISTCPGLIMPPSSPGSKIPSGTNASSTATTTVPVSPTAALAPRSILMGIGFHQSKGVELEAKGTILAFAITALLLIDVLY